jgi:hypothetical protein
MNVATPISDIVTGPNDHVPSSQPKNKQSEPAPMNVTPKSQAATRCTIVGLGAPLQKNKCGFHLIDR